MGNKKKEKGCRDFVTRESQNKHFCDQGGNHYITLVSHIYTKFYENSYDRENMVYVYPGRGRKIVARDIVEVRALGYIPSHYNRILTKDNGFATF